MPEGDKDKRFVKKDCFANDLKRFAELTPSYKMREFNVENEIRLAIVGAEGTGKSALTVRFLTKRFIGEYESNRDSLFRRDIRIADSSVTVEVKDTVKRNWLLSNPDQLINWASAIVVVYSVTDRESFLEAVHILRLIHQSKPLEPSCTLLLGNKDDLQHLRQVTHKEGKRLATDYGNRFGEVSAAESYENVYNVFMKLLFEATVVHRAKLLTRTVSLPDHKFSSDSSSLHSKKTIKLFMKDKLSAAVPPSPKYGRRHMSFTGSQ